MRKKGRPIKEDREYVREHLEVILGVDCAFGEGDIL